MSPRFHHRLRLALRSFFRRRAAERELEDELAFHFQQMDTHKRRDGRREQDGQRAMRRDRRAAALASIR